MRKVTAAFGMVLVMLAGCSRQETAVPTAGAPTAVAKAKDCSTASLYSSHALETKPDRTKAANDAAAESIRFSHDMAGYVIKTAALWDPRGPLTVCFFGGDATLRQRIQTAASAWTAPGRANLQFDFGAAPQLRSCTEKDTSNIRIAFIDKGYNSYVGTEALLYAPPGTPTMILGLFDSAPPREPSFTGVVLHEFGHALGFEHEHQNPSGGCDNEFDWNTLYAELCKPPNRWSKAVVDFNLKQLKDSTAYRYTTADRNSIMHYSFEPWMFRNGAKSPCFIPERVTLSDGDIDGARTSYPANAQQEVIARRAILRKSIDALPPNAEASSRVLLTRALTDLQ